MKDRAMQLRLMLNEHQRNWAHVAGGPLEDRLKWFEKEAAIANALREQEEKDRAERKEKKKGKGKK